METQETFICQYCSKQIKNHGNYIQHSNACQLNPDSQKYKLLHKERICKYCGETYTHEEHTGDFCSDNCKCEFIAKCVSETHKEKVKNNVYVNSMKGKHHSEETKQKIGYTLMHGGKWKPFNNEIRHEQYIHKTLECKECQKTFYVSERSGKFCSDECKKSFCLKIQRKNGGFREGSVRNYKTGWFNGIHCDSSWELAFVVYCIEHDFEIKRNKGYRTYYNKYGELSKFYPDFIVNGKLYEIKGNQDENKFEKQRDNPDVTFLYKKDIAIYLDYVISKYGNDFVKLYEKRDKQL